MMEEGVLSFGPCFLVLQYKSERLPTNSPAFYSAFPEQENKVGQPHAGA